jgi:hypothetical protein
MEKLAFEVRLAYLDFHVRNGGALIHPENYKKVKEAEFLIANNMPVPRGHLYVAMPEMFVYTAEDIIMVEQSKANENRVILGHVV